MDNHMFPKQIYSLSPPLPLLNKKFSSCDIPYKKNFQVEIFMVELPAERK